MGAEPRDVARSSPTRIGRDDGRRTSPWVSGAAITATLAADYVLFRLAFDANYFHWYIAYGGAFALALTVFSVAVDLDEEPNLIAAHPSDYVGAWFAFFGKGFFWLSGVVREAEPGKRAESFDGVITAVVAVAWTVGVFAWLLIVVPALYFVTFVCGAAIRRTRATTSPILVHEAPRDAEGATRTFNIGLNVKRKPVTTTNAIAAVLLYGLGLAL